MRAEQVTDPIAYHGEGPVWAASWGTAAEGVTAGGGLRWVDMLAGDVLSLRADGTVDRTHVGDVAAALRPRAGGGAVVAVERGFALISPEGELTTLPELWGADAGIRMNEGGCDPDGRFHCGTMAYAKTPGAANLYRLAPGPDGGAGEVDVVLTGATTSNGLEWSADGTRAYYNDTPTRQVAVFDYSREEGLTNRRVLVDVLNGEGKPDVHIAAPCENEADLVRTRDALRALPVDADARIVVSWEPAIALETSWRTFAAQWQAFCYPGTDDVTICPLDERWVLCYHHWEAFSFTAR